MDKVLRTVRKADTLFGGVFVVGAGDHYQCGCIGDVHPPLTSLLVRQNFDVIRMEELFRQSAPSHPCTTLHCKLTSAVLKPGALLQPPRRHRHTRPH